MGNAVYSENHWDTLAAEADRMAEWEASQGRYPGVWRNKAATYRAAAKAERIESETGVAVCSCCLKSLGGKDYWKR